MLPSIPTSSDVIGPPPHSGRTSEAPADLACVPNWPGCANPVAIGRWPNDADSSRSPKSYEYHSARVGVPEWRSTMPSATSRIVDAMASAN